MRHASWDDALFVHYPVDADKLQKLLPSGLNVDRFEGVAYIGIVCLSECGIVPWPAMVPLWLVRWLGLSHHAVNVRTYVRGANNCPPGIFFFTLECSSVLAAVGAQLLFHLPYRLSRMRRRSAAGTLQLESQRTGLTAEWRPREPVANDALGRFFVERYTLYNPTGRLLRLLMRPGATLWHGSITHEPWPLSRAEVLAFDARGLLAAIGLDHLVGGQEDCVAHASSGVGSIVFYWQGEP